jgi:tetratricopeptide (TPR) repeat protein
MTRATLAIALLLFLAPAARAADVATLYQESFTLESSGDYAAALVRMEALRGRGENDYLLHLRRGWLLYLNGKNEDAVAAYTEALHRSRDSVEARIGRTLPLMAMKRWTDAEADCRAILKAAPGNYTAMARLAWVLFNLGRHGDAEAAYRAVLVQYPSDNDLRAGLGWTLLKLGRRQEAKGEFDAVLRTVPAHQAASQGRTALEGP